MSRETIWDRLNLSLSDTERWDRPSVASFCPGVYVGPDGSVIAGLAYRTDYRAEEEYGSRKLREIVTTENPRQFKMTPEARRKVTVFTDVVGVAFHAKNYGDFPKFARWGDRLDDYGGTDYARAWEERKGYTRGYPGWSYFGARGVPDLRREAKELGITPLPIKRADLENAISERLGPTHPDVWPAWFEDGNHLILRADNGMAFEILKALIDAIENGSLGIGDGSGLFSTGMFFYDTRDETVALRKQRERDFDWYDARMKEVEPVIEALRPNSLQFHLGSPMLGEDGTVSYYMSRSFSKPGRYREYENEYGRFTLLELEEKAGLTRDIDL
jgi:hypothetical protein